jgi:hypothetical protein
MIIDEEPFLELEESPALKQFIDHLIPLRGGLYLDVALAQDWSCDADRCRPLMGRNLCCKVETRCPELIDGICSIHETKPFSCALFPIELLRVGAKRVVVSAGNPTLHEHQWTRFDRDMLRCFEGEMTGGRSMFEAQLPVLEQVLTRSELAIIGRALEQYREGVFSAVD